MTNNSNPGCLARLLNLLGIQLRSSEAAEPDLPYHAVDTLLSPAEVSFYHVLRATTGEQATIFAKVRLGDLLYVRAGDRSQNTSYRNRIDRKHVDFLLCDPKTTTPLAAIELDDASHQRKDRAARDEFVDSVFAAAGLTLVHIPAGRTYSPTKLAATLANAGVVLDSFSAATQQTTVKDTQPPLCPDCGVPMVARTATRGQHAGKQFYACPNYPKCRRIIPMEN